MKKLLVAVTALAAILFSSCFSYVNYDVVDTPDVKLYALPGVNVITIKDTGKGFSYEVFKTVGEGVEDKLGSYKAGTVTDSNIYLPDTDYSYRIVAVQTTGTKSAYLVDRTAESKVSMKTPALMTAEDTDTKGKFAPYGTDFLGLAKYESDYKVEDPVLSAETIKVEVIPSDNYSVIVTFPTKKYADYVVEYGDVGALEPGQGTEATSQTALVDGLKASGKGYVKFDSIGNNEKEVRVVATPKNNDTYKKSYVTASTKVQLKKASFSISNEKAQRISKDTVRVSFGASKLNGAVIPADSFKIYMKTTYNNKSTKDWNDVVSNTGAAIKYEASADVYYADITAAKDYTGNSSYTFYIVGIYNEEWKSTSITSVTDDNNYGVTQAGVGTVGLNIMQDVAGGIKTGVMKIEATVEYQKAAKFTAQVYIGKFDNEAKAKAAYLSECTTVIMPTAVVAPITSVTKIVDGVDIYQFKNTYTVIKSDIEAGITASVDSAGNVINTTTTGAYYKIYFVVTEEGKDSVVKSSVNYFTLVKADGKDPVWTLK